jgi:hypothetical protein
VRILFAFEFENHLFLPFSTIVDAFQLHVAENSYATGDDHPHQAKTESPPDDEV